MAKKKTKKNRPQHLPVGTNTASLSEGVPLQNFVQSVFLERSNQFQKNNSAISSIYEGLDLDNVRMKRRISAVVSVAEEVRQRFADICPDIPGRFSLTEDWVTMNTYPVSAYDYVEKYVFSTLGASIWLLDHLKDTGKIEQLKTILRDAPLLGMSSFQMFGTLVTVSSYFVKWSASSTTVMLIVLHRKKPSAKTKQRLPGFTWIGQQPKIKSIIPFLPGACMIKSSLS